VTKKTVNKLYNGTNAINMIVTLVSQHKITIVILVLKLLLDRNFILKEIIYHCVTEGVYILGSE